MPKESKNAGVSQPHRRGASGAAVFCGSAAAGFVATAVVLFLLRGGGGGGDGVAGGARVPPQGAGGPAPPSVRPVFTDVALEAGIDYRHEAGNTGLFYYPEVMGAGCAFFDYDGDGNLDVYLVNGNRLPPKEPLSSVTNVLYRNNGDGTFSDVTRKAGVGDASYGQGCAAADTDGDGDEDLYVTNFGPNVFYRNRGDGTFEKLEGTLADPGWGQSAAFFDADGDGDLDLYLQNYLAYSLRDKQDWKVVVGGQEVLDYCSPSGYTGQQDRLLLNDGGNSWRDATRESGLVAVEGTGMGLVCADLDGDGDMDIVVSNDSRPNFYFRNEGGGRFTQCALAAGLAYNAEGGTEAFMGVDAGDYDGDGLLDLAVPALRAQGFNLYRNQGGLFVDVSSATGVHAATAGYTGFAPVFIDYDSDGDLDLFFTTGEVRMGRTAAGADSSFEDRYAMRSLLLENREGRFVDVSGFAGGFFERRRIGRACSAGDYDNDGDLDLLVTSMAGKASLLRNDTQGGNWVGFKLEGKPPNRDAVGARILLRLGERTLLREIHAGGSYLGQRDRRLLFGLGKARGLDGLRVRWPDGSETSLGSLEIGRYHTLRQP